MDFLHNLVEYYDELYPTTDEQLVFIEDICKGFTTPNKILQIGSGSGQLSYRLAKRGKDVTGIEMSQPLLTCSSLKRRFQLLSIRFFKMSALEMNKYLGKSYYNVIMCLNNRLVSVRDEESAEKVLKNCKELLSKNGKMIIRTYNYEYLKKGNKPSIKKSERVALVTNIEFKSDTKAIITQTIEAYSKKIPVFENMEILPVTKQLLIELANKAGFTKIEFYGDYKKTPLSDNSEEIICVLE